MLLEDSTETRRNRHVSNVARFDVVDAVACGSGCAPALLYWAHGRLVSGARLRKEAV